MNIDNNGKISGLMDHYLGIFETFSKAPPSEMEDELRLWFAQFDQYTWESEEDFINDLPELGTSFGLMAGDAVRNGQCSTFVCDAFDVIAQNMLADLRILHGMGFYGQQKLNGLYNNGLS